MKIGNPSKLRTGEWGARVFGDEAPEVGEKIQLETKSGSSRTAYVTNCFWSGPDKYNDGKTIHLCETSDTPPSDLRPPLTIEQFAFIGKHLRAAADCDEWSKARHHFSMASDVFPPEFAEDNVPVPF